MTEQQDTDIPDDIAVPDDVALPEALVAPEEFRAAMARFPSGVVVVTTRCQDGTPRGFTASSFCSVSLEPPMVLVCLANSADSAWSFARCDRFAVSVLTPVHQPLALRFATKGSDKFAVEAGCGSAPADCRRSSGPCPSWTARHTHVTRPGTIRS